VFKREEKFLIETQEMLYKHTITIYLIAAFLFITFIMSQSSVFMNCIISTAINVVSKSPTQQKLMWSLAAPHTALSFSHGWMMSQFITFCLRSLWF